MVKKIPLKGKGSILVFINGNRILITNVNYTPNIKTTLISPRELTKKGWSVLFKDNNVILTNSDYNFKLIAS